MSQHSQRTQYGPSVGAIVTGLILTLGGGTAVAYMLSGPMSTRSVVGAVLGAGFTVLIGLQTLERAVERRVALDRIERQEEREREAARRAAEERRLRAEWEHATYGPESGPDLDPDPVATQPLPEEPDPVRVEHWATGGAAPSQPYEEPAQHAVETPGPVPPPQYAPPLYPAVEDDREPGRYPYHPRPTEAPDWADRDWPTEVMPRQD